MPATAAPELPSPPFKAAPRSPLSSQRQWTSSEQITVRSPTSEPAVLQRIIGQPVVVMPAAVKRMQAEEAPVDEAHVDEAHMDEAELSEDVGRPSTQQRYFILLGLVAAVIVPLCWASLGAFRPHQDPVSSVQAPQAAPQQSAAVATPILHNSQEVAPDPQAASGPMKPGDAAVPASSPGSGDQAGTAVISPATRDDARMSGSAAAVGSPRIPGKAAATNSARVSGSTAAPGGTRAPGGAGGGSAAAGSSTNASRSTDYSNSGGSPDNTNMSADAGGSAVPAGEHEEFPDIPPRIRQTIRGHVKVSVRVIIDEGGSVFAALVDSPGPSPYFDHVAIEAAKKWTFPPADGSSRLKLVRFDFSRDGTTGQAIELQ